MTLVDAGPLVALIDADDRNHVACRNALKRLRPPLLTVWPAVAEAMYLLADFRAQDALWEMLKRGMPSLATLAQEDIARMRDLMAKYANLPMDLADAALVRVAERDGIRRVFTIDRRDFRIYRPKGFRAFEILP